VLNQTKVLVVVPVHNGAAHLGRCLDALLSSDFHDYEIVVVDDASTDGSAVAARTRGVKVITLAKQSGPAAARNYGAAQAGGDLILFIDADVVVRCNTLSRVAATFAQQAEIAAMFGSYDAAPEERNFVSQFKNLHHHFIHQRSLAQAQTFWAGCGALRRLAFETVGGFNEQQYPQPSIEDIELGHRLRRKGFRILLDKELQVTHLKRWTIGSLLRTDILRRAVPWSRLILADEQMVYDLNLRLSDRISAALTWMAIAALALAYVSLAFVALALLAILVVFLLNLPLYRFLKQLRGRGFALAGFGMLVLQYFYSAAVFAVCYALHFLKRASTEQRPGASRFVKDA